MFWWTNKKGQYHIKSQTHTHVLVHTRVFTHEHTHPYIHKHTLFRTGFIMVVFVRLSLRYIAFLHYIAHGPSFSFLPPYAKKDPEYIPSFCHSELVEGKYFWKKKKKKTQLGLNICPTSFLCEILVSTVLQMSTPACRKMFSEWTHTLSMSSKKSPIQLQKKCNVKKQQQQQTNKTKSQKQQKRKSQSCRTTLSSSNWRNKASKSDWRGRTHQEISCVTIGRWCSRPSGRGFWSWAAMIGGGDDRVWTLRCAPAPPRSVSGTGSPTSRTWRSSARPPDW